jgi:hypothetical protein
LYLADVRSSFKEGKRCFVRDLVIFICQFQFVRDIVQVFFFLLRPSSQRASQPGYMLDSDMF